MAAARLPSRPLPDDCVVVVVVDWSAAWKHGCVAAKLQDELVPSAADSCHCHLWCQSPTSAFTHNAFHPPKLSQSQDVSVQSVDLLWDRCVMSRTRHDCCCICLSGPSVNIRIQRSSGLQNKRIHIQS